MGNAVLELEEKCGSGESFQITARSGDEALYVSVDNPYAGDTVSGFGVDYSGGGCPGYKVPNVT